jgi:transposase
MAGAGYGGLSPAEAVMSRRTKEPLHGSTEPERHESGRLSRSQPAPAAEVVRAQPLLAVADGDDYRDAARAVGRRPGDAVSHLVARFNAEGTAALTPRHGGGRRPTYGPEATARIAAEAARAPTPEADGTATWSLATLQRAIRAAPDGLPKISTYTIRRVLHEAGASYQRTGRWCPTGRALRRRKAGPAAVADPDSDARKS